jgi:tyrosinase
MTGPPRVRRNIDDLSSDELANYQHALKKLQEISQSDPESVDGYTYLEQMHDGDKGPCEHANDTFMPWHRGHLYLFEGALRRSDPPRTENVTVPYWDWSGLPSGERYPKAFEDSSSILFNFRNDDPICRPDMTGNCFDLPFPRHYLENEILTKPNWSSPLAEDSLFSFAGFAGGQSDCGSPFGLGFGALEQPGHNLMHGEYVAGDMADPSAAALDPIFWSFHCYIDLLWFQWQQKFDVDTDLEARLCGVFTDRDDPANPATWMRVKDVLDPAAQLGYTYEWTPGEPPPARPEVAAKALFPAHPAVDFAVSARKQPEIVRTLDVAIPDPGFDEARLTFTDVNVRTAFSYGADIYLAPESEEFRPNDRDFRDRHLADMLYFWKAHHHGGHGGDGGHERHTLIVDIGRALASLADQHPGEKWRVTVALAASEGGRRPENGDHDHGHHARDHHYHERAVAGPPTGDPAEVMNFGDLTLRVF